MSCGSFGAFFASGRGLLRLGRLAGSGRLAAVNGHSGARSAVATAGKEVERSASTRAGACGLAGVQSQRVRGGGCRSCVYLKKR